MWMLVHTCPPSAKPSRNDERAARQCRPPQKRPQPSGVPLPNHQRGDGQNQEQRRHRRVDEERTGERGPKHRRRRARALRFARVKLRQRRKRHRREPKRQRRWRRAHRLEAGKQPRAEQPRADKRPAPTDERLTRPQARQSCESERERGREPIGPDIAAAGAGHDVERQRLQVVRENRLRRSRPGFQHSSRGERELRLVRIQRRHRARAEQSRGQRDQRDQRIAAPAARELIEQGR